MFCCSLLANSEVCENFKSVIRKIFVLLLSKIRSIETIECQNLLLEQMKNLGERETFGTPPNNYTELTNAEDKIAEKDELIINEDTFNQQSKRSSFYKECLHIFNEVKSDISVDDDTQDLNPLYCPPFALYILNNWTGLASLWSSIHLYDQLKHSPTSQSYQVWSEAFSEFDSETRLEHKV